MKGNKRMSEESHLPGLRSTQKAGYLRFLAYHAKHKGVDKPETDSHNSQVRTSQKAPSAEST